MDWAIEPATREQKLERWKRKEGKKRTDFGITLSELRRKGEERLSLLRLDRL